VRKVYQIFVLVFSVGTVSSCVADSKYQPKMSSDARNLQWEEKNGSAALPLAAAIDFCGKEATDESAKIAAVLSLDKTYAAASSLQVLETNSLDTVKANEMSKCMTGLGYGRNEL
jgi:hypothetical protein